MHNVKNTDMVVAIDDEDSQNLLRLFNTEIGHKFLKDEVGLSQTEIDQLSFLGISGIANVLGCIKMAKYYELTSKDVLATVATDSAIMYGSRIEELDEQQGAYRELTAARDFYEHMRGVRTDSMLELSYEERKRIHNLKYYTWVEQQGRTVEDLNAQWYDDSYWTGIHAQAAEMDKLIDAFNAETGVLANMK